MKYYEGTYPSVFLDGGVIIGANSLPELVAWFKTRLEDDFIIQEEIVTNFEGQDVP